jgi:hypothetical protein
MSMLCRTMHPHTSDPYPNNPNCKTPFEVPLPLSHCSNTWGATLASSWYFEGLVCVIHVHKNHEQTENRNDEWHVESRTEEVPNRLSNPLVPSERRTEIWWSNLKYDREEPSAPPDGWWSTLVLNLATCAWTRFQISTCTRTALHKFPGMP